MIGYDDKFDMLETNKRQTIQQKVHSDYYDGNGFFNTYKVGGVSWRIYESYAQDIKDSEDTLKQQELEYERNR